MKILGIDPSLTSTGLALVEGGKVLDTKRVKSKLAGHRRVDYILSAIEDQLTSGSVMVGIEGPAMGAKGSAVVQIFGLWGVITHTLHTWAVPYYVVPPSNLKKYATGKGNADKDTVLAAVVLRYQHLVTVTSNDVADALTIAAMGARYFDVALEDSMPATHLLGMDKVAWDPS